MTSGKSWHFISSTSNFVDASHSASEQHQHHVAGGLKAALNNPNVSEEAKTNAQRRLEEMGTASETNTEAPAYDESTNRMLGGYKATLTSKKFRWLSDFEWL